MSDYTARDRRLLSRGLDIALARPGAKAVAHPERPELMPVPAPGVARDEARDWLVPRFAAVSQRVEWIRRGFASLDDFEQDVIDALDGLDTADELLAQIHRALDAADAAVLPDAVTEGLRELRAKFARWER